MNKDSKIVFCFVSIILLSSFIFSQTVFAQTEENAEILFNQATEHFKNGEYKEALSIYDEVLEIAPDNISTLKMKGIAQSNLSDHSKSLNQFYKILQLSPNDAIALTGMGIGFGNLGEYKEAVKYFDKAIKEKPNSTVIKNYKEFIDKVISKYPYDPTEKPDGLEKTYITSIPKWVKSITGWWASGIVEDNEFVSIIQYLLENEIIQIPPTQNSEDTSSIEIKENFEFTEFKKSTIGYDVGPVTYYYPGIGNFENEFEISSSGQAMLRLRILAENTGSEIISLKCTGPAICNYDVWDGSKSFKYSGMDFVSGQITINPGTSFIFNMMFGPNIGYGGTQFEYDSSKNYEFRISEDFGNISIPLKIE